MNLTVNRITGFSPYEIVFKKSCLDIYDSKIKILESDIFNKSKKNSELNQLKINSKRKQHNYSVNDSIYLKMFSPDKIDPRFADGYKVVSIVDKNRICVEGHNKRKIVNVKNVKPNYSAGQNVVPFTT